MGEVGRESGWEGFGTGLVRVRMMGRRQEGIWAGQFFYLNLWLGRFRERG